MIDLLLQLTISGTIVFALVAAGDAVLGRSMQARGRRWWWLCVPLGFLVVLHFPILPPTTSGGGPVGSAIAPVVSTWAAVGAMTEKGSAWNLLPIVWAAGVLVSLTLVIVRSWRVSRRWTLEKFSTDGDLLSLLEDCKATAGVTAPIGLVVTDRIETPAILGWLRPRILLPASAMALGRDRLAFILLHELAHFRAMDVPVSWAFAVARCIHWFNPTAYLAERAWARFREEAADERVLSWSRSPSEYGPTLLAIIRRGVLPFGALGISESFPILKHRLTMINTYTHRSRRPFLTIAIFALLALVATFRPVQAQEADPKAAAVAAMKVWLSGIDEGNYAASWTAAGPLFQKALTSEKWVAALDGVRKPLGKCLKRELASALHQTDKGDFVIAQFESSFENLKFAVETVTFERSGDTWKAAGYYIKPAN